MLFMLVYIWTDVASVQSQSRVPKNVSVSLGSASMGLKEYAMGFLDCRTLIKYGASNRSVWNTILCMTVKSLWPMIMEDKSWSLISGHMHCMNGDTFQC